ncbi:DUF1801 domain-containing protein [Luteimonas saliphila]|uniref:DUF1801 domain-containing protein n=1 Tax=Luteimonas saliphila TaxID=2804919 RepID=UPI00192E208B|nr:DUF1801 domain-containing protein [Luteimonas saliphila]
MPAASPDAYVAALDGWRLALVSRLRAIALEPAQVEERIRWGHLVYSANGPAYLIRAEDARMLFGFWRGQRLRDIESRLRPGGKYEMATLALCEGDKISRETVRRLVSAAIELNAAHGDPTALAKSARK